MLEMHRCFVSIIRPGLHIHSFVIWSWTLRLMSTAILQSYSLEHKEKDTFKKWWGCGQRVWNQTAAPCGNSGVTAVYMICSQLLAIHMFIPLNRRQQKGFELMFILYAFAELRKETVSFVTYVCHSAWNNSAPTGRIFIKFGFWFFFFKNLWGKIKFY